MPHQVLKDKIAHQQGVLNSLHPSHPEWPAHHKVLDDLRRSLAELYASAATGVDLTKPVPTKGVPKWPGRWEPPAEIADKVRAEEDGHGQGV